MPRPRFTLRTLLVVVATCAVGVSVYCRRNLPPHELRQVEIGMSRAEVIDKLGKPSYENAPNGQVGALLVFRRDWGRTWVSFTTDDKCEIIDCISFDRQNRGSTRYFISLDGITRPDYGGAAARLIAAPASPLRQPR